MRKFGLALFACMSVIVHVTAAAILLPDEEGIKEERGAGAAALEVGSLFDSTASALVEPETAELAEPVMEKVRSVEVPQAISVKNFVEQAVKPQMMQVAKAANAVAPVVEQLTANDTLLKPDLLKPDLIQPVEAARLEPKEKSKIVEAIEPKQIKKIKAKPAKRIKKKPKKKKTKRVAKTKVAKKVVNKGSKASRRGGAKASRKGRKGRTGGAGGKSRTARGKELMSNYKGRVVSRIRRKAFYPSSLSGSGTKGTPRIAFTILKSGRLSGLKLSRSSGNAKLDQAALKAVRRSAPFPKIPHGAGRASVFLDIGIIMRGR